MGTSLDFRGFLGINNSDDPARLGSKKGTYLTEGVNVDIDDTLMLHRRTGYEKKVTADVHSFWGKKDGSLALYVSGGFLKSLSTDLTSTNLLAVDQSARMQYVEVNQDVFFTNNIIIGQLKDGVVTAFPIPTEEFKTTMKPGHLIEFYNSRLYVAWNSVLWISDPAFFTRIDMRHGFKMFKGRITMLKAVSNGLYVSTPDTAYWMGGLDPGEATLLKIAGTGAIEGSAITVDSEDLTGGGIGSIVMWTSVDGVWSGGPGGTVKNKTWDAYSLESGINLGAATFRDDNGYGQYLFTYSLSQILAGDVSIPRIHVYGVTTSA